MRCQSLTTAISAVASWIEALTVVSLAKTHVFIMCIYEVLMSQVSITLFNLLKLVDAAAKIATN
jgi:hypothetical protein